MRKPLDMIMLIRQELRNSSYCHGRVFSMDEFKGGRVYTDAGEFYLELTLGMIWVLTDEEILILVCGIIVALLYLRHISDDIIREIKVDE